jgi:integrase
MSRNVIPLTEIKIKNAKPKEKDFKMFDGGGLFLLVKPDGSKLWRCKYLFEGKEKLASFGKYPLVPLLQARILRDEIKSQILSGIDHNEQKKQAKEKIEQAGQSSNNTFEKVANEWMAKKEKTASPKYAKRIKDRIVNNIFPFVAKMPLVEIKRSDIASAIKIVDNRTPETAGRCLTYIKSIFEYAEDSGYILINPVASINPSSIITKTVKSNFKHINEEARFAELLLAFDAYKGNYITRQLIRFLPLVITRPTEARTAEWKEVDFENAIWTIPAHKTKMKAEHLVPLSKQAIKILEEVKIFTGDFKYVFASPVKNVVPLSDSTIMKAIRVLGFSDEQTAHGFRHVFSTINHDMAPEKTLVIEKALSHKDKNIIRGTYNKAKYIEQRRELLQDWANLLDELKTKKF